MLTAADYGIAGGVDGKCAPRSCRARSKNQSINHFAREQDREQERGLSPRHMLSRGLCWDWGIARGVDGGCAKGRVNAVLPSWLVGTSSHTVRPDNAMRICDAVGVGVNSLHNGVGVVLRLYFQ